MAQFGIQYAIRLEHFYLAQQSRLAELGAKGLSSTDKKNNDYIRSVPNANGLDISLFFPPMVSVHLHNQYKKWRMQYNVPNDA